MGRLALSVLAISALAVLRTLSLLPAPADGSSLGEYASVRRPSMAKAAQGPRMSLPQGKALISLMAMRLRGGGNVLHEESWDVGKGIRVHVKV
jgi:hypothetical protein